MVSLQIVHFADRQLILIHLAPPLITDCWAEADRSFTSEQRTLSRSVMGDYES